MNWWDASDAVFMGVVTASIVAAMVFAIAIDARKLPLGRIKMVPWTMITIMMLFGLMFAGKLLMRDLIAS